MNEVRELAVEVLKQELKNALKGEPYDTKLISEAAKLAVKEDEGNGGTLYVRFSEEAEAAAI